MKAVHVKQWGGIDAAVIEDTPLPIPGDGEVLIRVRATSINPLDWKIREGYLQEFLSVPLQLGSDISGDVEAVGKDVTGFEVGMPIYGMKGLRGGGYAEFTTILPNEIARKPSTLSYAEAAAVPHTALTAWHSLFDNGNLQAGQRVLIHAAAGGVGHFAVQLAKNAGAYVIGTASENNEAFLRELGVDEFINYKTTRFEEVVKEVDLVLDGVGFDTAERSVQVIKPGGVLVCIVTPPPMEAATARGITAKYAGTQPTTDVLTKIAELIDSGKVKPHIQQAFPFSKIHEAMQLNQTQHTRGKVVVTVGEQSLA